MRVLWVVPYLPYPISHGGKARVFNLIIRLAGRHEITLVAVNDTGVAEPPLQPLIACCAHVAVIPHHPPVTTAARLGQLLSPKPMIVTEFTSDEGIRAVRKQLAADRFDAAIVEQVHAAEYLRVLRSAGVPALLICHNIERRIWEGFARYAPSWKKRLRAALEIRKLAHYEPHALRGASARLAVSDKDRQELERMGRISCGVSPNGVDVDYFAFQPRPERTAQTPWRLVMTGSMSYMPNSDAAEYFLDSILPRVRQLHPAVEVHFVGSGPNAKLLARQDADGAIHFTGFVDDVRPHVAGADLFIAPLRHGSGTRLKLLEAMAQGIAVVTTSTGCEGLEVIHGEHVWVADTPQAFADGIATLMRDRALVGRLAANARALVERRYSWERIANELEAELRRIARPSPSQPAGAAVVPPYHQQ